MGKYITIVLLFFVLSPWTIPVCGQTCVSDTNCSQGQICYYAVSGFDGICRTGSGLGCTADQDCPQGELCNKVRGTMPGRCLAKCKADADCSGGLFCNLNSGLCIQCKAHCDCPQGWFCYYGNCLRDPKTPVYCCTDSSGQPKAGCQPGRWCFEPSGGKGTCAESTSHVCQSACDCGPAHCCKYDPAVGHSYCVKDVKDPWNPGGTLVLGGCEQGVDATYCCKDPLCHAGLFSYGSDSELFRCAAKVDGSVYVRDNCGGKPCGSTCDCDPGESCIDIKGPPRRCSTTTTISCEVNADCPEKETCNPQIGKVCDTTFSLNPVEPSAVCVSNAVAEAVYGISPADLLPCCGKGCFPGQKCEVGWVQGGGNLLERVVGVCGGKCGNGTWDPGESAISCPSDCLKPPRYPDCGAMSNAYSFYFAMCGDGTCDPNGYTPENCMTCPQDCGAVCPQPVALCKDVTVNAGLTCTADASINNGSYIPGGSPITLSESPAGPYSKGDTLLTLTVTNSQGLSSKCTGKVTVVDNTPPLITAPAAITVYTGPGSNSCGTVVSDTTLGTAKVGDNCSGAIQITRSGVPSGNLFPVGTTTITYTATDMSGNTAMAAQSVTVIDNTPPTITGAPANPSTLWPPNHQMVPVKVTVAATDNCGGTPACKIISVSSNEPINGLGDGDTAPDWQITGNLTVDLRSERSGTGNGRIYTINLNCGDAAGNLSNQRSLTVSVPKSQKK